MMSATPVEQYKKTEQQAIKAMLETSETWALFKKAWYKNNGIENSELPDQIENAKTFLALQNHMKRYTMDPSREYSPLENFLCKSLFFFCSEDNKAATEIYHALAFRREIEQAHVDYHANSGSMSKTRQGL